MAYLLNKNTMSKIVKKKDLDVLIESTMSKAGIKKPIIKEEDFVNEFKPKEVTESTSSEKSLIKEDLDTFNKLINYTFKK